MTDMLKYWEPRRLAYNGVLAAVVIGRFIFEIPRSWHIVSFNASLVLFALAVMANILYCAAYVADWFVQQSEFRETWLQSRWLLLAIGTGFASVVTYFFTVAAF